MSPSWLHSPLDNSGALKADRSAGFLFPILPVLQGDLSEDGGDVSADSSGEQHKMTCGQFVLVTFFIVAGGPTGVETVVSSGGPLYAFIGLLIIPWLWLPPPPPPPSHTAPLFPIMPLLPSFLPSLPLLPLSTSCRCLPIALVSAELACALPENGGPIRYVERSFGRYTPSIRNLLFMTETPF